MTALTAGPVSSNYAISRPINLITTKLTISAAPEGDRRQALDRSAGGSNPGRGSSKRSSRAVLAESERLRRVVRRVTCSEPWAEFALRVALEQGIRPTRGDVAAVLAGRGIYPPAADTTPMLPCACRLCRARQRYWPAPLIGSNGWSLECVYESTSEAQMALLPGTVSTVDMARVRRSHRVRKW